MSKTSFFSKLKETKADRPARGDTARMPRGNVTALIKEMDTDNKDHGWLMTVEITGGTHGVGEVIQVGLTPQAVEWAEKGKLDQKLDVGSEVYLQRVSFPERNKRVYTAQRCTSFIVSHDDDEKKGRTVLRRVPYKVNMFQNGYAVVAALPDTKEEIDGPEGLIARIAKDQESGQQTLVVGRVNDVPFSAEAITGRYDREKGEFIPFDPETIVEDIMGRIVDVAREVIEAAEEAGEEPTIEMNAYAMKSYPVGQSTKDMLEENMNKSGRFSAIPLEAMFSRGVRTHISTALAALGDDADKVLNRAKSWVEDNLDAEGRKAYAQEGFRGLSEADIVAFLDSLGIKAPRVPGSQAKDWGTAREILDGGKRKRLSTGWVVGDLVIQTHFAGKGKARQAVMEYPTRGTHYTASATSASPFFPDGKFLQARNDEFFNAVREGFKAVAEGKRPEGNDKPDVADVSEDQKDQLDEALNGLFNEGDDDLPTDAFPAEDDSEEK